MQYTEKTVRQSIDDIHAVLVDYNAKAISFKYENQEIIGISFILEVDGVDIPYKIPCKWREVLGLLLEKRKDTQKLREDAKRIAWRTNFKLVEALCAFSISRQAEMAELFLPWMAIQGDKTLYEKFKESGFKLLKSKNEPANS